MIIKYLVTLGVGLIPGGPGTYGSLLTTVLAAAFAYGSGRTLAGPVYAGFLIFFGLLATWAVHQALLDKVLGPDPDPGPVVIDESLGMLIALTGYAWGDWTHLYAALVLFRFFDIVKPWPIGRLQAIPGAWGVMIDDLAAGLAAWGVIELVQLTGLFQ
jgi:phosphatidylglycerophosphatase A